MMTLIPLLFFATIGTVIGGEINPAPEDEPLYSSQMEDWSSDYDSLNDTNSYDETSYDPESAHSASRGGVRPACHHRGDTVACCLGISVKGHPLNTCVELSLLPHQMKAVAALKVNNHNVVSKDASVGKACAPLPAPLSMLHACLHVYYANVNVRNKYADVCFVFEVTHVLQVSFDCFRLGKGQFQHHSEHPPEKHGLINIGWAHGKPTFHLNMPKWPGK